ncbi:TolB-like translocation protein [Nakamurella lactea]|uniref:hypothetical protein n=1 Tax=Nakamurella lactea TaxID=459515 RepID=UPI0004176B4A|nr:hypothetical protein [Nakamurella lactea]
MTVRVRLVVLAVVFVLAIGAAVGYLIYAKAQTANEAAAAPAVPETSDVAAILAENHVVFRSSALGDSYGKLATVALADPGGPRAVLGSSCERVYATWTNGVCITAERGIAAKYGVQMLDAQLQPTLSTALTGLPSRARISADGSMVATTTFVTGHSYAASTFSTATVLQRADGTVIGNLEDFATTVDGKPFTTVDRNFWGVTFVDDDTFYATAFSVSAAKTWLVKGSIAKKTMTSLRSDAECPSVSPDRTRVAFKIRQGAAAPGQWHLAVMDLTTGKQTVLAETRSVDDQVEWLDNDHILYALPRTGADATVSDIWSVPADGTGTPAVFIPQASSPAVVQR